MAHWIVGDIHGCGDTFSKLRETIEFDDSRDTLILVGDLINRGPTSLETLRWIVANDHCVRAILGNHDVHLLWCALGSGMPKHKDTLNDILNAPDREELIGWLRKQPLARREGDALIVHAGIHPTWSVEYALEISERISTRLQADDAGSFLNRMRAGFPQDENERELFQGMDVLTRMRTLHRNSLDIDASYSGIYEEIPGGNIAWFDLDATKPRTNQVFFGHWAALGFHKRDVYQCLDSGCVWGRAMTAWRLEDGHIVTVKAVDKRPER